MTFKRTYSFAISNAARARGGRRGGLSRAKGYQEKRAPLLKRDHHLTVYGPHPLPAGTTDFTNVSRSHAAPGPCARPGCDYQPKDWLDAAKHYRDCIGEKSILHKIQTIRPGVDE